uniref:Methyltransferase domain-containing protein n=1 Tax=Globisporangium ultimum (strain ATCC 200006 / CBS 805.95 / DAOM BR144) TaxID=431595 RepID=K3WMT9_GLOUD
MRRAICVRMRVLPRAFAQIQSARRALRNWAKDREDVQFQFKCTQCGKCCTGKGGRVRVNDREIDEIARVTAMATADIKAQYLRHSDAEDQWFIQQTVDDTQCVFLEGNKCSIYQARPTQCRTFPWWPQNLISDYDWHVAARDCEGIITTTTTAKNAAATGGIPPSTAYSFDKILPEAIVHDIHRSGENFTYNELTEMIDDLQDVDENFVPEYKSELTAKFSRHIVYRDEDVTVMDTFFESVAPTRCFFFNDRIHLIQSEVALSLHSTVDDPDLEQSGAHSIDRDTLMLDVHRAMCIPFVWKTHDDEELNVAVLGSGAASLPLFLLKHIKQISRLDAVEPSATVNKVARKFFELEDAEASDARLNVHESMGEAFVDAQKEQGTITYDVIAIDVESGEWEKGIKAPPFSMLSLEFLTSVKQLLTPNGVLVVNVIAETPTALGATKAAFREVFRSTRVVVQLPSNAVFYLFNDGEPQQPPSATCSTDKNQLLESLSKDEFQMQRVQSPALLQSIASDVQPF